jgi:peptidoglycan/LPS O-acetylase OafA/YrhL
MARSAHLPALDGLRGVAILLVLAHQFDRLGGASLAAKVADHALDIGWIGVQLFFVLSGFLITGILLDSREAPHYLRSFFARRILRIFPLYFGALVVFLLILPAAGLAPPGWSGHQWAYWTYLSNWTIPYTGGALPHFWSLAVEEQFYLAWPFVVMLVPPRRFLAVCVGLALASLVIRTLMVLAGADPEAIYMFTTSRADALVLGGAAAAMLRSSGNLGQWWRSSRKLWLFAAGLGALGFIVTRAYPRTGPLGQTIGYTILAVVFASAILALALEAEEGAAGPMARTLQTTPFRALGLYSYAMYVFHKPLHDLLGKPALEWLGLGGEIPLGPGLAYIGVATAVTLAAGAVSYYLYERHFLAMKSRFRPWGPEAPP